MKKFNLEKALAGEPVVLRNGKKAFLIKDISSLSKDLGYIPAKPLVGMIYGDPEVVCWKKDGSISFTIDEAGGDIVGMWEEPRPTVTLTLPAPLKKPQAGMWYITDYCERPKLSACDETMGMVTFNRYVYFASREDADAWLDAMRNNRR